MLYLTYKLFHVISVILFLGNILTGLYWATHSHRTHDFHNIKSTFNGIIHSDKYFTIPGVLGITIAGIATAVNGKIPMLSTGWIFWSIILFTLSGMVFGIFIAPLQRKITAFLGNNDLNENNWNVYSKMYKQWVIWGVLAIGMPMVAVGLMVLKPSLPGV